jgi:hypothetical protein
VDSSEEPDARIVVVPCVTVNKGVVEASDVGLTNGDSDATDVPEGEIKDEVVRVRSPEDVGTCV